MEKDCMNAHKLPQIVKRDSTGKVRTWQAEYFGNQWRTIAGGPGRKDVTSAWTTSRGKQGRDDAEQAEFEANAAHKQKLDREYRLSVDMLDAVVPGPMLAHKYEGKAAFPAYVQPKLDGGRALISARGAFTREGQPWLNCDHILKALAPVFAAFPDLTLDGEFYNHDLKDDFGQIMSLARKSKPTDADRAESAKTLQYHIYDMVSTKYPFHGRQSQLKAIADRYGLLPLVFVFTSVVTTQEQLDADYERCLELGYEGQMVRDPDAVYEHKRSKSLLKRKEFLTDEFKLLYVLEGQGNWAGYAKRVTFQLPDGRECGAGIRGTQDEMKALLGQAYLGKVTPEATVTIRYFTPTPDGMPRFPVAIDFHFGGRKD
jgi:DNA ligase-1